MGEWMKRHNRSIYGCTQAPDSFQTPRDCRLTYNPQTNRIYVHVFAWPFVHLHLDGFAGKVEYAQLLNDASEIKYTDPMRDKLPEGAHMADTLGSQAVILQLPVQKPPVTVPVIELFLKK